MEEKDEVLCDGAAGDEETVSTQPRWWVRNRERSVLRGGQKKRVKKARLGSSIVVFSPVPEEKVGVFGVQVLLKEAQVLHELPGRVAAVARVVGAVVAAAEGEVVPGGAGQPPGGQEGVEVPPGRQPGLVQDVHEP